MRIMLGDRKDIKDVIKARAIPVTVARVNPFKDTWFRNWYDYLAPHSWMMALDRRERSREYYKSLMTKDLPYHMKTLKAKYPGKDIVLITDDETDQLVLKTAIEKQTGFELQQFKV